MTMFRAIHVLIVATIATAFFTNSNSILAADAPKPLSGETSAGANVLLQRYVEQVVGQHDCAFGKCIGKTIVTDPPARPKYNPWKHCNDPETKFFCLAKFGVGGVSPGKTNNPWKYCTDPKTKFFCQAKFGVGGVTPTKKRNLWKICTDTATRHLCISKYGVSDVYEEQRRNPWKYCSDPATKHLCLINTSDEQEEQDDEADGTDADEAKAKAEAEAKAKAEAEAKAKAEAEAKAKAEAEAKAKAEAEAKAKAEAEAKAKAEAEAKAKAEAEAKAKAEAEAATESNGARSATPTGQNIVGELALVVDPPKAGEKPKTKVDSALAAIDIVVTNYAIIHVMQQTANMNAELSRIRANIPPGTSQKFDLYTKGNNFVALVPAGTPQLHVRGVRKHGTLEIFAPIDFFEHYNKPR